MSIEQEIIEVIVDQLGVEASAVTSEKSFVQDLNADSLDLTELIMSLEERFGLEIKEEDAAKLVTVGDVISHIQNSKVSV